MIITSTGWVSPKNSAAVTNIFQCVDGDIPVYQYIATVPLDEDSDENRRTEESKAMDIMKDYAAHP